MRSARRRLAIMLAVGVAFVSTGCNQGPAEEALSEAEIALERARGDLEQQAPDALDRLEGELAGAREAFGEGRYTDALRTAQDLPERIRAVTDRVLARRRRLQAAWEELARTTAERLPCLRARLQEVTSASASSPDGEPLAAGRRDELLALEARWAEVWDAFQRGHVARAVEDARAVESRMDELSETLGGSPGC